MADRLIDFSVLNAYQDRITQTEKRQQKYGLIESLQHNTPMCPVLTPTLKAHLQTVEGRATEYTGLKEDVITTTTTESFTVPANLSTSEQVTLSMITIASGFQVYPAWFQNNTIAYEEYLANKYDEVFSAMASAKETQIGNKLNTNKTQLIDGIAQINGGDGTFAFDGTNDWVSANKAAQKDVMFSNLESLFGINKMAGSHNAVVNKGGLNLALNEILKFGAVNSENRQFIQNQLPLYFETLGIAPSTHQFIMYMMNDGAIGGVQNYPFDFRTGTTVDSKIWGITDTPVPYVNERLNVYYNKEATDASALGDTTAHLKMTSMEEWEFIDKFFLVTKYNSDLSTRVSDIVKVTGLTT